MPGLPAPQVLCILRLRQWAFDRQALKDSRVAQYHRLGWRERRTREVDARIVRVMDFERALHRLNLEEQAALISTYRDGMSHRATARALGCSDRKLAYLLPLARVRLADILDRLDLL